MFYCGVDPHKQFHVVVIVNEKGIEVARKKAPATLAGYSQILEWVRQKSPVRLWGCENPQSYGRGLAQFLIHQGEEVRAVHPLLTGQYRCRSMARDKSDPHDALAIARALLREEAHLPVVQPQGQIEDLRLLLEHYDNLRSELTKLINRLHSHLLALDAEYGQRGALTQAKTLSYWLEQGKNHSNGIRWQIVVSLCQRGLDLNQELSGLSRQMENFLEILGVEPLLEITGVGVYTASKLIAETGHPDLFRSEAAWVSYAGAAPLDCSSGKHQRHRLNRGGNRQLNAALHRIVLTQLRCEPSAKAYFQKKKQEGKTDKEARRCLKRFVARRVFGAMKCMRVFEEVKASLTPRKVA